MRRFINPLLLLAAHAWRSDLIRQIQYLKVENLILRSKLPRQVPITPRERQRLIRYARPVGATVIRSLASIVTPNTFYRWLNGHTWNKGTRLKQPGRPRTAAERVQLVLRIARETGWGYTRILGELKKLNIHSVSRSTVVNILKRNGLNTGPARGQSTWDEFISRHAQTLWACDLLPRRILTFRGWQCAYALVLINVKSRLAWVSPATLHPTREWTAAQTSVFARQWAESPHRPRIVLHDNGAAFGPPFKQALQAHGAEPLRLQLRSPNLNAYVERFIQTLQQECLDHFLVFGTRHMDHLLKEFLQHYHDERPHQGLGNRLLSGAGPPSAPNGHIRCRQRLGGLLRHYYRQAA